MPMELQRWRWHCYRCVVWSAPSSEGVKSSLSSSPLFCYDSRKGTPCAASKAACTVRCHTPVCQGSSDERRGVQWKLRWKSQGQLHQKIKLSWTRNIISQTRLFVSVTSRHQVSHALGEGEKMLCKRGDVFFFSWLFLFLNNDCTHRYTATGSEAAAHGSVHTER